MKRLLLITALLPLFLLSGCNKPKKGDRVYFGKKDSGGIEIHGLRGAGDRDVIAYWLLDKTENTATFRYIAKGRIDSYGYDEWTTDVEWIEKHEDQIPMPELGFDREKYKRMRF